ncbi:MAG: site-specific DNA-methyltransferase [Chloroflexi bacterium]|nr:site-specific DNA-methyltransferase [Chloroflexota bacterium]
MEAKNNLRIASQFDEAADVVLFGGDIREFLKTVPDNHFKLIVTSPPYNLGKDYEKRLRVEEYVAQQREIIEACVRALHPQGSICWQVGNYVDNGEIIPIDILLYPVFASLGLKLRNRIIWEFGHGLHASKRFSGRYEVILWFTKSNQYHFNLDPIRIPQKYPNKKYFKGPKKGELSGNPLGKNPSDIWEIPNVKANHVEKTEHPCQFPIELVERLVLSMTEEGDWVLDPFMGVGSTAIAALMHNRKAAGAEIMPDYLKIAQERIHKAEKGELRIRPMERPVFDPNDQETYVPPRTVRLGKPEQKTLFESKARYGGKGKKK